MKIACISDKDARSALYKDLWRRLSGLAAERGHAVQRVELDKDEISACRGCLQCWEQQSDECVSRDPLGNMTRNKLDCDLVIYLAPVVFGTCNSTIKNAVDRSELLFRNPKRTQVVIGYADDMDDEEKSTFIDLIARHRGQNDVVHPERKETIAVFAARSARDSEWICRRLEGML